MVFIDEAGSHVGMAREYARAPVGVRADDAVPRNRGNATTMIGALAHDGLRTLMTIEGATTGPVFEAFVEHMLVPVLSPGEVVVVDNLGAHKLKSVRERVERAGCHLLFLPSYSPDLNPIENCWSKLKGVLRTLRPNTKAALQEAIATAMDAITAADAAAWFTHCGWTGQLN